MFLNLLDSSNHKESYILIVSFKLHFWYLTSIWLPNTLSKFRVR